MILNNFCQMWDQSQNKLSKSTIRYLDVFFVSIVSSVCFISASRDAQQPRRHRISNLDFNIYGCLLWGFYDSEDTIPDILKFPAQKFPCFYGSHCSDQIPNTSRTSGLTVGTLYTLNFKVCSLHLTLYSVTNAVNTVQIPNTSRTSGFYGLGKSVKYK